MYVFVIVDVTDTGYIYILVFFIYTAYNRRKVFRSSFVNNWINVK